MTDTKLVRLQKFLSECGVASRRKAEELIISGKVKVNGKVVDVLGSKIDPENDRVQVRNKPVQAPHKGVLILHKPRGVVSTLSDPEGRAHVGDFITKHYRSYFPVGRLDYETSGLVILTNDGEMAEHLLHPRYEFERIYEARVAGRVPEGIMQKIEKGVRLKDGVAQAHVRYLSHPERDRKGHREAYEPVTWLEIRVMEGKNRMVRRLMESVGHPVSKLKRVAFGPFRLGKLKPGELRRLTGKEYEKVRYAVMRSAKKSSRA